MRYLRYCRPRGPEKNRVPQLHKGTAASGVGTKRPGIVGQSDQVLRKVIVSRSLDLVFKLF